MKYEISNEGFSDATSTYRKDSNDLHNHKTLNGLERTNEMLLSEWVTRLGLQDWTIKLETNVIPFDMITQDSDGEVTFTDSNKIAKISITNEKCYGNNITPFDFERILVHELLHLKFCLLDDGGIQEKIVHQLINDMAKALVGAKRGTTTVGSITCSEGE